MLIVKDKDGLEGMEKKIIYELKELLGDIQIKVNFVNKIAPEASGRFRFVKSCSFNKLMDD